MRRSLLATLVFFSIFFAHTADAETFISEEITGNVTWTRDAGLYIVSFARILPGASLTIEPGTIIKVPSNGTPFIIDGDGTLTIGSVDADPVIITSIKDDSVGGDSNHDTDQTSPHAGDWHMIVVGQGAVVHIANTTIKYGAGTPFISGNPIFRPAIKNNGGILTLDYVTMTDNGNFALLQDAGTTTIIHSEIARTSGYGIFLSGGTLSITDSSIHNNATYGVFNATQQSIDATNNWWGSATGPTYPTNPFGVGDRVTDNVQFGGWYAFPEGSMVGAATTTSLINPPQDIGIALSGWVWSVNNTRSGFTMLATTTTTFSELTMWECVSNGNGAQALVAHVYKGPLDQLTEVATSAPHALLLPCPPFINQQTGLMTTEEFRAPAYVFPHTVTFAPGEQLTILFEQLTPIVGYVVYGARNTRMDADFVGKTSDTSVSLSLGDISPQHPFYPAFALKSVAPVIPPPTQCLAHCYSNVLFLPGIMGSTLYRYDHATGIGTKVWEPSLGGTGTEQVEQLHMNPELATSNNADVYAKEILREDWSGSNYYKTFAEAMDEISGVGKPINEWEAIPYDWRLAPEVIVASGKKEGEYISYLNATPTPYIIQELKRLAASSKTGKVTIIAHSYGGLVTKALTEALGVQDASLLIDNIIFVAVPQAGTPQAIAGMLYGKNQDLGFGLAVSEAEAQSFAATLPMAYTLIPSRGYFTDVHEQVVTLPDEEHFAPWRAQYGRVVGNWDELHAFISNASDRELLQNLNIISGIPPALSHTAHMHALGVHDTLDAWAPPVGVTVTQIAGWGIPKTVKGVTFEGKPNGYCSTSDTVCQDTRSWQLIPGYDTTMDGDGTVVTPSALWTSATVGAVNYWVNLKKYGRSNFLTTINREHGDILEIPELTNFLLDTLIQNTKPLADYEYLTTEVPTDSSQRLRYSLHSPLTLDLYDDQGRHTGVSTTTGQIETQITGTYFSQIGEVKYLFTDASSTGHIIMDGYATGTFTFAVEELLGDSLLASTTWKDIPTTPYTRVTISVKSDITTITPMQIDRDGNGTIDFFLPPQPNGVVTMPKPALTITANSLTALLGSQLPPLTATISGFVGGDVASTSIAGEPHCTTTATNTSTVGTYPIHCTIGTLSSDIYEFTTFVAGTLKVLYRFDGFIQPINDTVYNPAQSMSVFKGGSTVPVKFQIKNASGSAVQSSTSPIWLAPQKISPMSASVDESAYSDPASSGSTFKWDSGSQQYVYNWSTKGLTVGYWYRLSAKLEDGILYTVTVGVR